jgi:hypothetical protein
MALNVRRLASALRPKLSATTWSEPSSRVHVMLDQRDGDVEAVGSAEISSRNVSSSLVVEPRRQFIEQRQWAWPQAPARTRASESPDKIRTAPPDGFRPDAASSAAGPVPALPVEPTATRRHWRKIRRATPVPPIMMFSSTVKVRNSADSGTSDAKCNVRCTDTVSTAALEPDRALVEVVSRDDN